MSAMQKQSTVGKDVRFERIRRITGYLVGTTPKRPRSTTVSNTA